MYRIAPAFIRLVRCLASWRMMYLWDMGPSSTEPQSEKGALIGMNATVLDKADIGEGAIIAAGAVVTHGTKVPAHEIWAGIPARKVKVCAPGQAEEFAKHYSGYIKDWYLKEDK